MKKKKTLKLLDSIFIDIQVLSSRLRTFFSSSFCLYTLIFLILILWWGGTWKVNHSLYTENIPDFKTEHSHSLIDPVLPRALILKALRGDLNSIEQLTLRWCCEMKRKRENPLGSIEENVIDLQLYGENSFSSSVIDEIGHEYKVPSYFVKYTPQTYASTAFLLSLVPDEEIVTIPSGMRKLTHIYENKKMKKIAIDSGRENSELIYMQKPNLAFVADYSHPSMIETFKSQNIHLFYLNTLNDPEEILQSLEKTGAVVKKPLKAKVLADFVRMAHLMIQNKVVTNQKALFLQYTTSFIALTSKNLTVKLFESLGGENLFTLHENHWSLPISKEMILNYNPEIIFLIGESSQSRFFIDPAFENLKAVKEGAVYSLDSDLHYVSDHFYLLALFDYFEILKKT
jgi:ABC-type Fe3+-hydroxamate transport system substrate-binding protein